NWFRVTKDVWDNNPSPGWDTIPTSVVRVGRRLVRVRHVKCVACYAATAGTAEALSGGVQESSPWRCLQSGAASFPVRMAAPAAGARDVDVGSFPVDRCRLEMGFADAPADLAPFAIHLEFQVRADETDAVRKWSVKLLGRELDRPPLVAAGTVDAQRKPQ